MEINRTNKNREFDRVWENIVLHQGELFHTITGKGFTYKVIDNDVYPTHIKSGHATKEGFRKAFGIGNIQGPGQLSAEGIMGPSYVYAILTDTRIK